MLPIEASVTMTLMDNSPPDHGPIEVEPGLAEEISRYLLAVLGKCRKPPFPQPASQEQPLALAEKIFTLLTKREFCYLSKKLTKPYKMNVVDALLNNIRKHAPLDFFYDIGPGYHASITPDRRGLSFEVGLAEVFILSQASSFCNQASRLYPPGVTFTLVIDNICALLVNDIPITATRRYCTALRRLIAGLKLDEFITLLVESERFPVSAYESALERLPSAGPPIEASRADVDNVARFLGRQCSTAEAARRMRRYERVTTVSEQFLEGIIEGVHMTQRATPKTIGFRPFPGGDARVQTGEVVLSRNAKGAIYPVLLTSRNCSAFERQYFRSPETLRFAVEQIPYAVRAES